MHQKKQYTEKELVEGCLKNDRFFQERLYRTYAPAMMRMCYRYTKDQGQVLEIVNNGFLKVFKKLDAFGFQGSLEGWIRRIVYRALSDYFRQHNNSIRFLELDQRDQPVSEGALSNLYLEDILHLVDLLPNASKEVFCLYAIEGYNHREIGEMLQISDGTSKWHLATARKQLKKLINTHYNNKNYAG